MPFTTFALPLFRPVRWDILGLVVLLSLVHLFLGWGMPDWAEPLRVHADSHRSAPWQMLSYALVHPGWVVAIGNAIGVGVGMTMASRTAGPLAAWVGIVGASLLAGLWMSLQLDGNVSIGGASPALFAALGMGSVAWRRIRHELTYGQRRDLIAGFGTIGLVAFALAMPLVLNNPAKWIHGIGLAWGLGITSLFPRHWDG